MNDIVIVKGNSVFQQRHTHVHQLCLHENRRLMLDMKFEVQQQLAEDTNKRLNTATVVRLLLLRTQPNRVAECSSLKM